VEGVTVIHVSRIASVSAVLGIQYENRIETYSRTAAEMIIIINNVEAGQKSQATRQFAGRRKWASIRSTCAAIKVTK
jgi:hypothetical protein